MAIQVFETGFRGLKLIQLAVHGDERGFFVERFNEVEFKKKHLPLSFAQDNHSRSAPGVLRGLHYQVNPFQGKMVGVVRGKIWDVVVDLRREEPSYLRHFSVELSDLNGKLLWIPPGFAHGFCVVGESAADVMYKVDSPYTPSGEVGIRYDDPRLGIGWPTQNPILSTRDMKLISVQEWESSAASRLNWP
jgi:dTDP-4-dehydrorhamnose 3,5-epimerase